MEILGGPASRDEELILSTMDMAHYMANKFQRTEEEHDDLVQNCMLALLKAVDKKEEQGEEIENFSSFASVVFLRALQREMQDWRRKVYTNAVSVPDVEPFLTGRRQYFDERFCEAFLDEVGRVVGPMGFVVAHELLWPSPQVMEAAQARTQEIEDSTERCHINRGPKFVVTNLIIREHLGLSYNQWRHTLDQVKAVAQDFDCSAFV